jgi:hypothetical protein
MFRFEHLHVLHQAALLCVVALFLVHYSDAANLRAEMGAQASLSASVKDALVGALGAQTYLQGSPTDVVPILTNATAQWQVLPQWEQITFGVIILVLGCIIISFGYRLLSLSVFILGGFIAAVFMYGILGATVPDSNPDKSAIVNWTSLGTWVVFGIVCACCLQFAIFVMGFAAGVILALVLNPIALQYVWPEHPYTNLFLWMVGFGLIGGCIMWCFERPFMIITTSAGGALMIVGAVDAFTSAVHLVIVDGQGDVSTPWQAWALFGGFLVLTLLGIILQFCVTAAGYDHRSRSSKEDL